MLSSVAARSTCSKIAGTNWIIGQRRGYIALHTESDQSGQTRVIIRPGSLATTKRKLNRPEAAAEVGRLSC